ncbi:hypothetical protein [Actinoplanes subtropicus]|uniref:hypothetical protein n=1 Tax=Actinoplanes subtropicus TaxID=543632 RepID=UPI0012FAF7A8|nr:hypothetical protein [Actinoplanes subtropicus]
MQDHDEPVRIRGLVVPPLLLGLLRDCRWRHPGETALNRVMPWFKDPLHFLDSVQAMARESNSLDILTDDAASAQLFRQARGTRPGSHVDLPWLDVDKAFLVAVNKLPGDDTAIALDYRTDHTDPRVVASDFWTDPRICSWREVTPTFSALVGAFGL